MGRQINDNDNIPGWIGVDLDGTLAEYHGGESGQGIIGLPIPLMVNRVKQWLTDGYTVKIVTARVSHDGKVETQRAAALALLAIMGWCEAHVGVALPVTNEKDYNMIELWDDRAVGVKTNTGQYWGPRKRV